MTESKICSKCKTDKPLNDFNKSNIFKDGHRSECKTCRKIYREKNKTMIAKRKKEYQKKNKGKEAARGEKWYKNNRKLTLERAKDYRKNNKEKIKKWKTTNKEKLLEYNRSYLKKYHVKKYDSDPQYNIKIKLRSRIGRALKRQEASKKYKTIELLGCNFSFYKIYIESLFIENMSWEKLTAGKIHIDHIKPCILFDLMNPEEQKKCFHYSNTQPLWAIDNMKKGSKFEYA